MSHSTRREFMKTVGQGTVAAGVAMHMPEAGWLDIAATDSIGKADYKLTDASCDVLVVGAGVAGLFAAIKAREQGAVVIVMNKGVSGRSGQSPFATGLLVFDPAKHKLDQWMETANRHSEFLNNRYWTEICFKRSPQIYQDMIRYGVPFIKSDQSDSEMASGAKVPAGSIASAPASSGKGDFDEQYYGGKRGDMPLSLQQHAEKIGVKFMDRVMMTELLKQNGRIAGAVGLSLENFELFTVVAKSTILCTGACSFKPAGYPPLHQLSGDGEAAAFRAGAEILGKEFIDTHPTREGSPMGTPNMLGLLGRDNIPENLRSMGANGQGRYKVDEAGNRMPARPAEASQYTMTYLAEEFAVHQQKGPVYGYIDETHRNMIVGGACLGMSIRKADGLWPATPEGGSNLPGLYSAGDSQGSMQNGAVYSINGGSTLGSAVTGAIAGEAAAREALKLPRLTVDSAELARARNYTLAPRERKGGYSPRWVTQLLQNTMTPYFTYFIKKADRLQATITQLEFMQQQLAPALLARDPHELKIAHETRSMLLSAEIRMKSALFRTESRGNHYREDHPRRDDQNWQAWTKVSLENGQIKLVKVPIPKEWAPDAALAYEKKYPVRFPGE